MLLTVITPFADVLGEPQNLNRISERDSQLLYGEQFQVEQEHGAYVYGHCVHDGYKGYVERAQLVKNAPAANALVKVRQTHLYPEADFKSRPEMPLSFLSHLTTTDVKSNGFTQLDDGSWVFTNHIAPKNSFKMPKDMAETANIYLGTPYVYGGRSSLGIDCSALIQHIVTAHGNEAPMRDCKEQEGSFGTKVNAENLKRNDIVYFKGHVGIMLDERYIINATARHMTTVIEDVKYLEEAYDGITHVARIEE